MNLQTLGQCSDRKIQKGSSWRISGPTYCFTSCSPVVRALVCQSSGPGSNPGMSFSESAIKGGTRSCCSHLPCFCELVVTYLQDSWQETAMKWFEPVTFGSVFWTEATEGQKLETLIASLLVAQELGRWCVILVAQVWFQVCLVMSPLLQGGTRSCRSIWWTRT